jgi:steroid delta-isomerase
MNDDQVRRYVDYFEALEPASLAALGDYFSDQAHFVDPFNDVYGASAIRGVFEHMFAHCDAPEFRVEERVADGPVVYLRWAFRFGSPAARRVIHGVSRVRFDADGRAAEHIDYWDPARQVYERIPLLGPLLRALRRRLGAAPGGRSGPLQDTTTATQRKQT